MSKPFNWKVFFILWAAAILGVAATLPYQLRVRAAAGEVVTLGGFGLGVLVVAAIQFGLYTLIGLWLANRIGLGLPILEAALRREPVADKLRAMLPISIGLGVAVALVILGLHYFVFTPLLAPALGERAANLGGVAGQPAWLGFLVSIYGAINEEILVRLLLMSLLAWLGHFISKTADGRPTPAVLWVANVLAAVVFGLGHLRAVALDLPMAPLVVARTVLLNGIGAIVFGWLYMKRGLESAIVSHFSTDIVLHVPFGS